MFFTCALKIVYQDVQLCTHSAVVYGKNVFFYKISIQFRVITFSLPRHFKITIMKSRVSKKKYFPDVKFSKIFERRLERYKKMKL